MQVARQLPADVSLSAMLPGTLPALLQLLSAPEHTAEEEMAGVHIKVGGAG